MIEEWLTLDNLFQILLFLFFVIFGVFVNFLFKPKGEKIEFKRIAREFMGAIWISIVIFAILVEFFNLSMFFIFVMCSVAGFGNSKIIDFFKKDLFELLFTQLGQAIKNLVEKYTKSSDSEDDYYPRYPRYPRADGGNAEDDLDYGFEDEQK